MTRLVSQDIVSIPFSLPEYDRELIQKTGHSLKEIAKRAARYRDASGFSSTNNVTAAAVSITTGQGIISRFSETVATILSHLGFETFVAVNTDVAGIAEAFERSADLVMMADDERFVVLNRKTGRIVDNLEATGRGFATALMLMAGNFEDQLVLIMGCGGVGSAAACMLLEKGARIALCDTVFEKANRLADQFKKFGENKVKVDVYHRGIVKKYRYLIDATPAGDIITADEISAQTMIAAPGMPCGLTADANVIVKSRLIHDPLQLGVAVMAFMAIEPNLE